MYSTIYNDTLNNYDPALMSLSSTLLISLHCTITFVLSLCVYVLEIISFLIFQALSI